MKVTLSLRAIADIEAVSDHIAQDSRSAADRFSRQLLDACVEIGALAEGYQIVDEWDGRPVRRRPYRAYSIFYVVREKNVIVLRVRHASRDSRLFDD